MEGKKIEKRVYHFNLIPLIIIGIILFRIINNPESLGLVYKILNPFIWAFVIAYLLNPPLVYIEKRFKIKRILSILIVYFMLISLLVSIVFLFTPRISDSIANISDETPQYVDKFKLWIDSQAATYVFLNKYGVVDLVTENLSNILNNLSSTLKETLITSTKVVINITSALLNFVLGLVISIYILKDKEVFSNQLKKLIYALFNKKRADYFINLGRDINMVFSKFLIGKSIDSIIIGIICFIGLLIIKAPYPLVISTIVGITNMIPYFGPFIGMIPAVLITLFYSPIKALWVFIFILGLQQFDGLYLGPKILGTQVGLKPFWVISAIIVGGGLFGFLGMFLAIPVSAVLKTIIQKYVFVRLNNKNIKL